VLGILLAGLGTLAAADQELRVTLADLPSPQTQTITDQTGTGSAHPRQRFSDGIEVFWLHGPARGSSGLLFAIGGDYERIRAAHGVRGLDIDIAGFGASGRIGYALPLAPHWHLELPLRLAAGFCADRAIPATSVDAPPGVFYSIAALPTVVWEPYHHLPCLAAIGYQFAGASMTYDNLPGMPKVTERIRNDGLIVQIGSGYSF
jgi:hypothetical protein